MGRSLENIERQARDLNKELKDQIDTLMEGRMVLANYWNSRLSSDTLMTSWSVYRF